MNLNTQIKYLDESECQSRLLAGHIFTYISALFFVALSIGCSATAQRQNILGKAAFEQGNHAQAINSFQQVLNRDPNNADAYYNLAACYYQVGVGQQNKQYVGQAEQLYRCLLYTSPSPRDKRQSRMPSSA